MGLKNIYDKNPAVVKAGLNKSMSRIKHMHSASPYPKGTTDSDKCDKAQQSGMIMSIKGSSSEQHFER